MVSIANAISKVRSLWIMRSHRTPVCSPFIQTRQARFRCRNHPYFLFHAPRFGAIAGPVAVNAVRAHPHSVELVHDGLDQPLVRGHDSVLEISPFSGFRTHARAREVRAAAIRAHAVYDHALEMHARTEQPLETLDQVVKPVEIFLKCRARLFRVEQPEGDAMVDEFREHLQEWNHPAAPMNIQVLEVRCCDPDKRSRLRNGFPDNGFVDFGIGEKGEFRHSAN